MCPKSSDSSSVSGIAPQLSDTIGLSRRSEWKWIGLRDQPLAGARLAGQQNRAVGARDGLDHLEDVEHRLAAADDVRELVRQAERPLQQHVLLPQLAVLDLLADLHLEQIDVERLAQVVARARAASPRPRFRSTRTP